MPFSFWKYLGLGRLRPPELILFDHLYSEYRSMKIGIKIKDEAAVEFIEGLSQKVKAEEAASEESADEKKGRAKERARPKDCLSWDELYYFELILADHMPSERLRSKIARLRSAYQSIASEKEYSEYQSSMPKDLQDPPDPDDEKKDEKKGRTEELMRADLKDLLGRIYFKYTILPVREERLTDLAWFAARLCLYSLVILLGTLAVLFILPLIQDFLSGHQERIDISSERFASLTIFVVVVCGAMGGFVSALQRIQSPPTEGDSLYNLSLLFHGSKSVFIAPITGAIFATILYMMFAAGILQGAFFPAIFTPGGKFDLATARARRDAEATSANRRDAEANANRTVRSPTPQSASNTAETPAPPPAANSTNTSSAGNSNSSDLPANANVNSMNTGNGNLKTSTPAPGSSNANKGGNSNTVNIMPTPDEVQAKKTEAENAREPTKGLNVFDFLARSGPGTGKDYALLIIWCFIAGFAERFVPDALDRVISNSKPEKKK
jgi:hypothetical protein